MNSPLRSRLGLCLALGVALTLPAQTRPQEVMEHGIPFIQNYTRKDYSGDSQNWAAVQDPKGLIYVGNNLGVLEYDGSRWRLIQTPRRTTVRSLALDPQGRVYVGAVGEIGYLAPDASGQMSFVDLTPKLEPSQRLFSDVWMMAPTSQGLLFQCREYLFLWKQDRFQAIKATSAFHLAFAPQGKIFVRQRDIGLMELIDGHLKQTPGGARFAKESIFMMESLGTAAATGESGQQALRSKALSVHSQVRSEQNSDRTTARYLIGTRNIGLWTLAGTALTPLPSDAQKYLTTNALYSSTRLRNGSFALATLRGGVVLLDAQGQFLEVLNRERGLLANNVKQVMEDRQGCLWMALDTGIAKVEYPSPFSQFDERLGLKGNIWNILRHQGHIYAATTQGFFSLGSNRKGMGEQSFQLVEGISTGVLSLLSMEKDLLVATGKGVSVIQGNHLKTIRASGSTSTSISLLRSGQNTERVFIGLQGGLASISRIHGRWCDEGPIPGVQGDVYSMAETKEGYLWLGTMAQGAMRVRFQASWKGGIAGGAPIVERFGANEGLPEGSEIYVHRIGEKLLVGTRRGFYRFDESRHQFLPDEGLAHLFPEGPRGIRTFQPGPKGSIWLDSKDEVHGTHESGVALPQSNGSYRWEPTPFQRFLGTPVETIYPEPDGTVWFGSPDGIFRYDPRVSRDVEASFPALVRGVFPKGSRPEIRSVLPEESTFSYRENALRFEFAAPSFDQESANRYQVKLDGYDRDWSPWSPEALKEYTNLHEGRYLFRVRARNIYGRTSSEGTFAFRILPPWFRTWWAYGCYGLFGCCAILLVLRLRTRLLQKRNIELQHRVDQATLDVREREKRLAAQAEELATVNTDLQALNLQLRNVNEEKNQFLGMVVHDLRNPLNGILLAADMIVETTSLPEAKAKSRLITRGGAEMNNMIARFLDIAALDAGQIKPEPETLSLDVLLAQTVEYHRATAQRKGIAILTNLPPDIIPVQADPKFLRAIIDNLLSNALKFSPQGTAVTVGIKQSTLTTELSFADNGPGLTEDDRRKLYGRFVTLSARPTGGEPSTGLGLSIVKKMLDAMGAQIQVESQVGIGSVFRVILPSATPFLDVS